MSVDTENIRGVFADLDDGGLDESEALAQIRELVGAAEPPKSITFAYLVPLDITIDLEDFTVRSAQLNVDERDGVDRGPYDGDTGKELDEDKYADLIAQAVEIADTGSIIPHITFD